MSNDVGEAHPGKHLSLNAGTSEAWGQALHQSHVAQHHLLDVVSIVGEVGRPYHGATGGAAILSSILG